MPTATIALGSRDLTRLCRVTQAGRAGTCSGLNNFVPCGTRLECAAFSDTRELGGGSQAVPSGSRSRGNWFPKSFFGYHLGNHLSI